MTGHGKFERMVAAPSTLTPDERHRLLVHLRTCQSCRERVAEYHRQDTFLRALALGESPRSAVATVIDIASQAGVARRMPFYRHLLATFSMREARTPRRMAGLAVLFMLGLVILSTVAYAASSIIHVYRPEEPMSRRVLSRLFVAPLLPPYQTVHYRTLDPQRAAEESGYALAYLRTPPAGLRASVGVDILPHVGWQEHEPLPQPVNPDVAGLAMAIRSVVRYRGGGHTAIVLLNEPSPRAIKTRELVLGSQTVHLPDGREAWTSTDVSQSPSFVRPKSGLVQVISWVVDHYVVSIFSDLPPARLRLLAAEVQVVAPKADPRQRRIPATWPTPLPLERLPARLQVVPGVTATYQRQGATLTIRYFIDLGSYSQGALYGLDKWKDVSIDVVFPRDLQRRSRELAPHQEFPGGSGGFGGDFSVPIAGLRADAVARLLRPSIDVRLAWTEQGKRRRQVFHFPIVPAMPCTFDRAACVPTKPGH